ncbi:DNA-directed RNA polymerase III subunit rpc3 [Penicillium argentinense]|uniref:DNA-directed RNA polymerase III subunit RPC3 n=1 Tax=Penicillium argentinense TaxID=1131581 RepID=A0A9W9K721_9EURO|nr:DNA-directed RNA polymerase III subunit rpc3 [Penicillium argentinense]KAJ5095190.1 DNA-directed RNA polymerase III subunit rpc3 [Penicillium argentinense]
MSQYAAELCTLLVEDNFGELCARIFSTLQRHERLSFPRLKFHSGLTDRQLRHGLVAMIQQHLIYHFTSFQDGITYYEANPQAAYYLVRSGKILQLVEDRLGEYAARVMEFIIYLGHTSVRQLESLPELKTIEGEEPELPNGVTHEGDDENLEGAEEEGREVRQTNGAENEDHYLQTNGDHIPEAKPAPFHATLKALASHGYILEVKEAHFQSPDDRLLDAKREVSGKSDIKTLKGKKQEESINVEAQKLVSKRTKSDLSEKYLVNGLPRGAKRKFGSAHGPKDDSHASHNRIIGDHADDKDNEWSDDEDGFDNIPMDARLIVRVNYSKLDVALRNVRFLQLAEQDAPPATAEVYETFLRRTEYTTTHCRDSVEIPREGEENPLYSNPVEVMKIVQDLDPELDLSGAFGPVSPPKSVNHRGKRPLENGINGDADDESDDEGDSNSQFKRMNQVNQHLSLLSQAPHKLITPSRNDGVKWVVDFRSLACKLRHLELERMIESRYGDVALRVVRVLHAKGKLDEKRLGEISLLPIKDLRQTLASMQKGGFVDLQEVPKDSQRQPSKTIYLWYYDPDRVCSSILEDTYRAMSRTLQRIKFEREKRKDFLEKTERSDVKGNEEHYLTEQELALLQRWKDIEALLLTEVSRLDDMVAVFRDY